MSRPRAIKTRARKPLLRSRGAMFSRLPKEPLSRVRGEEMCLQAIGLHIDERPRASARAGARSGGWGEGALRPEAAAS